MSKKPEKQMVFAIAWYRAAEWEDVKAFCVDRDKMESSYLEWRASAEKALKELKRRGQLVEKVDFSLEEFKRWCKSENKRPDAAARSQFAVYKSFEDQKSEGNHTNDHE